MVDANGLAADPEEEAFGLEQAPDAAVPTAGPEAAPADDALHERPVKKPLARRVAVGAVFLAACAAIVLNVGGTGALSSFGWESIASICPLGALESMVAAKLLIPQALAFLLIVVVAAIVLGKFFCSWVCPVPSIRSCFDAVVRNVPRIASTKTRREDGSEAVGLGVVRPDPRRARSCGACASCSKEPRAALDSRHIVLGGTLLSAAVFGFPVFCLVCPIGLTFASIIALVQLFGIQTLSWGVVAFPLLLVLELTVLRKWCSRFCPLGALVSLLSRPNRLFRPKVDGGKCLRGKGVDCTVCADLCPEGLDPHFEEGLHDCSKCRDCAVNCPARAISFPARR